VNCCGPSKRGQLPLGNPESGRAWLLTQQIYDRMAGTNRLKYMEMGEMLETKEMGKYPEYKTLKHKRNILG
jgi:hypothetical protein